MTEKRLNVGIKNWKNEWSYPDAEEEDLRMLLLPEEKLVKPNKLGFKYHKPTEVVRPNPTEKELNPEQWKFYDVDLDAVREEIAKNVFIGKSAFTEEFNDLLHERNARKEKRPEFGTYNPYDPHHEPQGI